MATRKTAAVDAEVPIEPTAEETPEVAAQEVPPTVNAPPGAKVTEYNGYTRIDY